MISRRNFIIGMSGILSALIFGKKVDALTPQIIKYKKSKIALIKTSDRALGIKRAINLLGINPIKGKNLLLKPNFNSSDPFPGSTHNDTLTNLILHLKTMGAKSITIGERNGSPRNTSDVLKEKGIYDVCKSLGVSLISFDKLPSAEWVRVKPEQSHWRNGFDVAKPVLDSECIVSTCCLKTHGYGGVFTMSLKLSVSVVHKRNMLELHTSFFSMRKMIAEINQVYIPALIVLDGTEAFVEGGPAKGQRKRADVILVGTDRIAIDAVGLSILKELGSKKDIMKKKIFEQEQIARAVELGLGVENSAGIEIVTDDEKSRMYADKLRGILLKG